MVNKAIKYRVYPTDEQIILFAKTFGCCRKVYNLMLADKIAHYAKTKEKLQTTPAAYKNEYPYLKEVDSLALANVQLDLQGAFNSFFKKRTKFPKYKSYKRSKRSYTTNNQKGSIAIVDDYIKLPKIGLVKAKLHRMPKEDWMLKAATVSMKPDKTYYISLLFEIDEDIPNIEIDINNSIGLDYKSDGLYTDSYGNIGSNHKFFRESYKKLRKAQQKLSRMERNNIKGYEIIDNKCRPIYKKELSECKNYQKQKLKIAKIHRHIANQRLDNLHKISTAIAKQYDVVCVESLNMKAIANKKMKNGKSTMDNGYGMFLNMLEYKLTDRGKAFIKVDKWFPSSQLCSCCGFKQKLELNERTYNCPNCGESIDRDYNAALNILNEGLRMLAA